MMSRRSLAVTLAVSMLAAPLWHPGTARAEQQEYAPYPPPPPQGVGTVAAPPPSSPSDFQPDPRYAPPPQPYPYQPPQRPPVPLHYEERPLYGLAIAGGASLAGVYLFANFLPAALDNLGCTDNCNQLWPLYIPVVGPFIQIGRSSNSVAPLLVLDGVVQVGCAAMLIAGLAVKRKVPVYGQNTHIVPYAASGGAGLMALGRF